MEELEVSPKDIEKIISRRCQSIKELRSLLIESDPKDKNSIKIIRILINRFIKTEFRSWFASHNKIKEPY